MFQPLGLRLFSVQGLLTSSRPKGRGFPLGGSLVWGYILSCSPLGRVSGPLPLSPRWGLGVKDVPYNSF